LEIDPLDGDQIETLVTAAYAAPKPTIQRAAALVDPHKAD